MRRSAALLVAFAVSVVLIPAAQAREGFGLSKKAVNLAPKVAPEILLTSERISVRVEDDGGFASESRKLRDLLEETMTSYDARFFVPGSTSEILVHLDVRDVTVDESWRQKREYETRQVGTKVEYDSKGKKKEKPVYGSVPIDVNYKDIRGTMAVRYRVVAGESELHSGEASTRWEKSYKKGDGAPMSSEVEKTMIDRVAAQISTRLVGAREPVSVLVPRGSFDRLIDIAEQGRWQEYLTQVEAVGPFKKPAAEAYRQYALGVAREALAYESADEQQSLELLQAAADHYRQAVAMNGGEKLFAQAYSNIWTGGEASSPIERVSSGVTNYRKLQEYRLQLAAERK
jgi:hypothetical protein